MISIQSQFEWGGNERPTQFKSYWLAPLQAACWIACLLSKHWSQRCSPFHQPRTTPTLGSPSKGTWRRSCWDCWARCAWLALSLLPRTISKFDRNWLWRSDFLELRGAPESRQFYGWDPTSYAIWRDSLSLLSKFQALQRCTLSLLSHQRRPGETLPACSRSMSTRR